MSHGQPSPSSPDETRALVSRSTELVFRRFRLKVLEGPERGLTRDSDEPELVIGTAPGTHLTLTDPTVSRHHCAITATAEGFLLRDLDSKNGTTMAGYRVRSAYLKAGTVLGVGETSLRFDHLDEEVRQPLSDEERYGRALGQSAAMRRLFALLPRIAGSTSTVLIEGETGTGKGLVAEAIHQSSPRASGPFVVVDCSAIPPNLIEAELFGHVKGAFTGAVASRPGAFEAARGGTVFLDEIGELPLDMQPKLLRALEERVVKRVGSLDPVPLDMRVVAATHRDLRKEVNRGRFRADLFYRLNVVRIRIPPLRERIEDIPLLVAHFYEQLVTDGDPSPPAELLEALAQQDWPGNVRELRAAVERAVLLGDAAPWRDGADDEGGAPDSAAPPAAEDAFDPALSFRAAKEKATSRWERAYLRGLLRAHGGNLSAAARAARMDRSHLHELLRRHDLSGREE
ncbi:sigma 54-interacting transcriptional regulator [Sorangium sp. So ce327]|uniref:sigma 54-interacting transcriptional regulator n=1 Tax=unclassified Sorangium TaxID=2621164 RepID=UPI003F610CFF